MRRAWRIAAGHCVAGITVLGGACGDKAPVEPSNPTPQVRITLTATGAAPKTLEVALGARVLFVNGDTRDHSIVSDPHPEEDDCPGINVGFLSPGQSRETGNLVQTGVCGFHDRVTPTDQSFWGTIAIK